MNVLIIKMSSMGDLIHTLPAISDATKAIPDIKFDWVADKTFAYIPRWHNSVKHVIESEHRVWKKNVFHFLKNGAIKKFIRQLREKKYDIIIDAQSNLRSAFVTRLAKGNRCGCNAKSVREWGAQFFYQKKVAVNKTDHAVKRLRTLFAEILNYPVPTSEPDYGINVSRLEQHHLNLNTPFIFLNHNTSREHKRWPEKYWCELIKKINNQGYQVILPWGNNEERERATRLEKQALNAFVLPALTLSQEVAVLSQATAAVSVDTGFGHIAAALGIPNINLYGPMDPKRIGAIGKNQIHISAHYPECAPCNKKICAYKNNDFLFLACMASITPENIFHVLTAKINQSLLHRKDPQPPSCDEVV